MLKPTQDSDGRGPEKEPEKSSFAQTCNLLSQFVKRRGSLRDLNLEIGGRIESLEAIVNSRSLAAAFAPPASKSPRNKEKSAQPGREKWPSDEPFRCLDPESSVDINVEYASNSTRKETVSAKRKCAQLTMFYGGRVFVFDDYPEDRAKELVTLAEKGSSQVSYGILSSNFSHEKWGTGTREGLPPRPQGPSGAHKHTVIWSNIFQEKSKADTCKDVASSSKGNGSGSPLNVPTGSDMPIARRSSLHRFLEKRKDRAGGGGPYQIQEQAAAAASSWKADEQLELKL